MTLASGGTVASATVTAPGPTYAIVPSAAVGTGLGNYTIGYVNGSLTVSQATLTVTAKNKAKTYGQTVTLDGTADFTASGLLNSDTVASVTLTPSGGTAVTATVADSRGEGEAFAKQMSSHKLWLLNRPEVILRINVKDAIGRDGGTIGRRAEVDPVQ